MKRSIFCFWSLFFLLALSGMSSATPSTQIWNPSTDIQALGVWHFGIDDYFTLRAPSDGGYAAPTDIGLTYGLFPGLELGFDSFLPSKNPMFLNAKYGVSEGDVLPAVAFGGFGFGGEKDATDQNVLYAVMSKSFLIGRITAGYFTGNEKILSDPDGKKDNAGIILTWDKYLTDKLWLCIDYAGTRSTLGSTFYGFSFSFASNVSVIFGYGTYNKGGEPTVTTQLDINI